MLVGAAPQRLQAIARVPRPTRRTRVSRPAQSRRTNVKVEAIGNLFAFLKPPAAANPQKRRELVTELLEVSSEKKPDEERISNLVGLDEVAISLPSSKMRNGLRRCPH
eukprot:1151104-Pelagomonas_calceolata.AAC.1